jgi:hypothetical protein
MTVWIGGGGNSLVCREECRGRCQESFPECEPIKCKFAGMQVFTCNLYQFLRNVIPVCLTCAHWSESV